jgi:hypothetical protein
MRHALRKLWLSKLAIRVNDGTDDGFVRSRGGASMRYFGQRKKILPHAECSGKKSLMRASNPG